MIGRTGEENGASGGLLRYLRHLETPRGISVLIPQRVVRLLAYPACVEFGCVARIGGETQEGGTYPFITLRTHRELQCGEEQRKCNKKKESDDDRLDSERV